MLPVQVADCLDLPVLSQARVLGGQGGTGRVVRWVAVIEWPVEDFVGAGDLVLTTAIGCDEERFRQMVGQMAEAEVAAICVSTGRGAPLPAVPESVIEEARRHGVPLIDLPWRVRFSDVSRAVIQALYGKAHSLPGDSEGLPAEFTRALLGTGGVTGIAEALEAVVASPVVILDAALVVLGTGEEGAVWIADRDREADLVDTLLRLAQRPGEVDADRVRSAPLAAGAVEVVTTPVQVRDGMLGWVVAIVSAERDGERAEQAVLHAGTAAAIELLRGIAHEEAESRARADFVWRLATDGIESAHELAAGAALLGLPLNAGFTVGLGLVETAQDAAGPGSPPGEAARRLRRRFVHRTSLVAVNENELLVCAHESERGWGDLVEGLVGDLDGVTVTWGVARGVRPLAGLGDAMVQARAALAITRSLRGPGTSGDAGRLGAFMLLQPLSIDPMAIRLAGEELAALEDSDRVRGSDLLQTMQVFFEENGNISAAARRLYLNRHSLIYRLRKIEQLTGRDLNSHEDRLVLDVSMRIRRLQAVPAPTGD